VRRTTIIAGSAVAALAAAGVLAVSGGAEAPTGQTIQVVEKGGIEKFVDTAPRAKRAFDVSAGDAFLFSSPLFNAANKRVGTLDARCDFTKGGKTARGICEGVFDLADGDLLLSARVATSGNVTGAIVGGTGAYAGARGTFTSVDRPGGDNAPSDDTITLLP
jgi:hypothetical protein